MVGRAGELVERLRSKLADDLRTVVGRLDRRQREVGYVREDLAGIYSDEMRDEIPREAVLDRLAHPQQSELFPELGDPHSTIRVFDHGVCVLYWGGVDAAFVAFDPDVRLIPEVLESCEQSLDGV